MYFLRRYIPASLGALGMLFTLLRGARAIHWPWFYVFAPWAVLFAGLWVVLACNLFAQALTGRRERQIRQLRATHKHRLT